jgi:hypothetical protein
MFASTHELNDGLGEIKQSPNDLGRVELIVCRPEIGERLELDLAELDIHEGLIGDNWKTRGKAKRKAANTDMQLNIMNSRAISLIAKDKSRWKLAGDQFYVDFDLSKDNIPAGTVLEIGTAIIAVTHEPHLGCKKFQDRFGKESVVFVNSDIGKSLNLRGINAKVLKPGKVKVGDVIKKV